MLTVFSSVSLVLLLLLAPGLALLRLSRAWSDWRRLQLVMLAFGIGLSLYPVIFYALRLLAPEFRLQAWMGWGFLLLCSGIAAAELRHWRLPLRRLDVWLVVLLTTATFLSRIWLVYDQPFPAWTDSLHHTLLTSLTAEAGRLPNSLQPYMDIPLRMYHLGLYALTGLVVQMLGIPAHSALLWTAQTLNALSVVGIFLVLDRYAGRVGAIAGILVVGLLSFQPAFYANWGRFTQLSAQTLMLIAWVMIVDTLQLSKRSNSAPARGRLMAQAVFAGIASAAVFLYHFRVSIFFVALLLPTIGYLWWQAHHLRELPAALYRSMLIGIIAVVFVMPAVLPAAQTWFELNRAAAEMPLVSPEQTQQNNSDFFTYDLSYFASLAARPWLLSLALFSIIYGIVQRDRIAWLSLLWFILLMGIGNLHLLRIPIVALTNMGAILIMLYMPIALTIGAAVQHLAESIPDRHSRSVYWASVAGTVLLVMMFLWVRAHDFEEYRFFVTRSDERAAAWLKEHSTPTDKVVINTTFWLPTSPHGTDAGYWLPYLAGLQTNTGVMIASLGGVSILKEIIADSTLARQAESDPNALKDLYERGYRFLYVGARGNFDGGGFNVAKLLSTGQVTIIYDTNDVTILRLLP